MNNTLINKTAKKSSPDALFKGLMMFTIPPCDSLPDGMEFSCGNADADMNEVLTLLLSAQMMGLSDTMKQVLQAAFDVLKKDPTATMQMSLEGEVVPYKPKQVVSEGLAAKIAALKGTPTTQAATAEPSIVANIYG